jgi:hypothetical protein
MIQLQIQNQQTAKAINNQDKRNLIPMVMFFLLEKEANLKQIYRGDFTI